ncbi:MAG: hypothetical protein ACR2PH_14960, partial [Desulfobulbia bacterium]
SIHRQSALPVQYSPPLPAVLAGLTVTKPNFHFNLSISEICLLFRQPGRNNYAPSLFVLTMNETG